MVGCADVKTSTHGLHPAMNVGGSWTGALEVANVNVTPFFGLRAVIVAGLDDVYATLSALGLKKLTALAMGTVILKLFSELRLSVDALVSGRHDPEQQVRPDTGPQNSSS